MLLLAWIFSHAFRNDLVTLRWYNAQRGQGMFSFREDAEYQSQPCGETSALLKLDAARTGHEEFVYEPSLWFT
jgi:hypothetical protein